MPVHEPEKAQSTRGATWRGYLWGTFAVLTCPCHLPILALLLSGTAAGAFVSEHMGGAVLVLAALFALFPAAARRAFRERA